MELSIIGCGAGGISLLMHLSEFNRCFSKINIFCEDHNQSGYAYQSAPKEFILNTRLDALKQFNKIININQWLKDFNYPYTDTDFIPRCIYGLYLQAVKKRLIKSLEQDGVSFNLLPEAQMINNTGDVVCSGREYKSAAVVVAVGFGKNGLSGNLLNKINAISQGEKIEIYGSGLAAIDLITYIGAQRPDLTIDCCSLSGRFPRIRSNFSAGGPSLTDDIDLKSVSWFSLNKAFNASLTNDFEKKIVFGNKISLADELAYVCEEIPLWQEKIYNATSSYVDIYQRLSKVCKQRFQTNRAAFIETRAMFPQVNARKILALQEQGRLTVHKRRFDIRNAGKHAIMAFSPLKPNGFIENSHLPANDICGVDVDSFCRVKGDRNIYVLGPMTNGARFFTEATSLTVRDAGIVTNNVQKRLKGSTHAVTRCM